MKKFICMIMALCMMFSMVACSNETEPTDSIPEPSINTEVEESTQPQDSSDEEAETTEPEQTISETENDTTDVTESVEQPTEKEESKTETKPEKTKTETTEPTTAPTEAPTAPAETKPKNEKSEEEGKTNPTTPTNPPATEPTTPSPTTHTHSCTTTIVEPTCKDSGYTIERCACGYEDTFNFIPAYEHAFGDWITVCEPTTTTNGQKMRVCSRCNHQEFAGIEKLTACETHTWVVTEKETVDAYALRHYGYVTTACSVCGEKKGTEAKYFKPDNINYSAEISTIISMVNSMRANAGLSQLTTSGDWNSWANTRAQEISVVYSHNRPNGASWGRNDGVDMALGENIAKNCNSGADYYYGFLNSPQHSGLMKAADATGIAVGIYVDDYGNTYCAMVIYGPIGI